MDDEPLVHRRTIEFTSRDGGDRLLMSARIHDQRYRADDEPWSMHQMELDLEIRIADATIDTARSTMHDYPHAECTAAESAVAALEGLVVGRGFSRTVRERIGGTAGCDHVAHLATAVAPATIQALGGLRSRRAQATGDVETLPDRNWWERLRNSCHIWADGGVGEQKVAIGWGPSHSAYPAPSLSDLEAERSG